MTGTSGHGGYHQCYEDGEEHWDGHRKKAMDMDMGRLMVSGRLLKKVERIYSMIWLWKMRKRFLQVTQTL